MKPNWKKCAKQAYEKGYEDGVKGSWKWHDAEKDPPEKYGTYLVAVSYIDASKGAALNRDLCYFGPIDGWETKDYVVLWAEALPLPEYEVHIKYHW